VTTSPLPDGPLLAEGSVFERLRRDPGIPFDVHVGPAGLALDDDHSEALAEVHRAYLRHGLDAGLPMLLQTDTWRAAGARVAASPWSGTDVNRANVELVSAVAAEGRDEGGTVVVAGLLGPAGDAYNPAEALAHDDARRYHAEQADALAGADVDLLLCATVPALSEALGLAAAMGATGLPYVVGFVVRPTGRLLDGTPLDAAVAEIDAGTSPAPLGYILNCVHPDVARDALDGSPVASSRVLGLLANTAALDPDELDGSEELVTADPEPFASAIVGVAAAHGLDLLGGCCGTDDRHIAALAAALTA
jgi:homocysteine S-methyltransferase